MNPMRSDPRAPHREVMGLGACAGRRISRRYGLLVFGEIEFAFGIDGADDRLIEFHHVHDQLRIEPHVRIDEEEMARIGPVEPVREQDGATFHQIGEGEGGERAGPAACGQYMLEPEQAPHIDRIEHLAKGGCCYE